jgi:hypothetical protein
MTPNCRHTKLARQSATVQIALDLGHSKHEMKTEDR